MSKGKFIIVPRVLAVLYALFLLMFSFDVFQEGVPLIRIILAFLMHNIPVILIFLVLIYTWKKALWAAVGFLFVTLAYLIFFGFFYGLWDFTGILIIYLPPLIISGLFYLSYLSGRKEKERVAL